MLCIIEDDLPGIARQVRRDEAAKQTLEALFFLFLVTGGSIVALLAILVFLAGLGGVL